MKAISTATIAKLVKSRFLLIINNKEIIMPEGAECKLTAELLARSLSGRTIQRVEMMSGRYLRKPFAGFERLSQTLPKQIVGVGCHGKFIYLLLDDGSSSLWSTLGMTGYWSKLISGHPRVALMLDNDEVIYYHDTRNFGTLRWSGGRKELKQKLETLGPDMLSEDVSHERFQGALLKRPKITLAEALMNQHIIAGVGNYIKAESLWLAKLSPRRIVDSLTLEEFEMLNDSIKRVIRMAYNSLCQITEQNQDIKDENSSYLDELNCYRKKTDPNGEEIIKEATKDGRTTWWAPAVQF